jgi:hypothetical protein
VLRWINLALAVVLAALLVIEFTRSREPEPAVSTVITRPPVVTQETPGRRSRRMEAKMAIEESRRLRRQRLSAPSPGRVELDSRGNPIKD